jgi:hypothetical protein
MKALLIAVIVAVLNIANAQAECREERTAGATLGQARLNCEVILKGEVNACRNGGNISYCSCSVGCFPDGNGPGQRFTRTMGGTWQQARTNCELILKGDAQNCRGYGNNNFACDCYY